MPDPRRMFATGQITQGAITVWCHRLTAGAECSAPMRLPAGTTAPHVGGGCGHFYTAAERVELQADIDDATADLARYAEAAS